jgi:polysaccharide biosynthesis/export protein
LMDRAGAQRRRFGQAALGLAALGLCIPGGCAHMRKHRERKIPQYGVVDLDQPRELSKVTLPSYVVEPPDELIVSVRPTDFGLDRQRIRVQADGTIDLGFDGGVNVAGLTLNEAEAKVASLLTERARIRQTTLKDPVEVSLQLADDSPSKVYYVIGTVATQGEFPLRGGETVLKAILLAGLRSNSLPEKAYLVRPQPLDHESMILRIDWQGIKERGETATNYQIMPGDRIVVPGGRAPSLLQSLIGGS